MNIDKLSDVCFAGLTDGTIACHLLTETVP